MGKPNLIGNSMEVGGSNPSPLTKFFIWNRPAGLPECPYLWRTILFPNWFSIRLHHWVGSDDARAYHDHSWWYFTLVLWGGYVDISDDGYDLLQMGSFRFRRASHAHTVQILRSTWTLMITGRPLQHYSFFINGKRLKRDRYFAIYGHHPCNVGDPPVRMRPDHSRI